MAKSERTEGLLRDGLLNVLYANIGQPGTIVLQGDAAAFMIGTTLEAAHV